MKLMAKAPEPVSGSWQAEPAWLPVLVVTGLVLFVSPVDATPPGVRLSASGAGGDGVGRLVNRTPEPRGLSGYKARVETQLAAAERSAEPMTPLHLQPCLGGMAGPYPCSGIDLLEFLPVSSFGATATNNVWGWTDPLTGNEYALVGLDNGVAFVDVTIPADAIYLGKLPSHSGASTWRDVRVYRDHAYVVADSLPLHGMQVFDLTELRNVPSPPVVFAETAHYSQVGKVHTISIDEETGYAYLAGSDTCHGGLHIVDLSDPLDPSFVACYDDGAYIHENQCFVYHGPDAAYVGHEICLAARGTAESLDILDVTDHAAPLRISTFRYQPVGVDSYSHQAWFTDDHRYVLLDDEFDEQLLGHPTRTWIFDAQDLDALVLAGPNGYFAHATAAIDHNLYVRGPYVFQSNYRAGLRILALTDLDQGGLEEVAYFDVDPTGDQPNFAANWGSYPYFASGVVLATHISQGLFVLSPTGLCDSTQAPSDLVAAGNGDHRIDLSWIGTGEPSDTYRVERALNGCAGSFEKIADDVAETTYSDLSASGQVTYGYRVRTRGGNGLCVSDPSECVEASTTGTCTAPPAFAGLQSATNRSSTSCRVDLAWTAATSSCSGPVSYSIHRDTAPGFVPGSANRIAEGVTGLAYQDLAAPSLTEVHYIVRAIDGSNGSEDGNLVRRSSRATGPVDDGTFSTGAEIGDPPLDSGGNFAPEHVGWHITDTRAHLPSLRAFWSTEADNLCVTLEGDFVLTPGEAPELSFWTAWDVEPGFDGGVVDLSTDGGSTWIRLEPIGGYPSLITAGGTLCGVDQGSGAFNGYDNFSFVSYGFDLSAWAGRTARLRWLYRTDPIIHGEGWFVDDIEITHTQVTSACVNDGLLIGDFEEGDFSEWSAAVP